MESICIPGSIYFWTPKPEPFWNGHFMAELTYPVPCFNHGMCMLIRAKPFRWTVKQGWGSKRKNWVPWFSHNLKYSINFSLVKYAFCFLASTRYKIIYRGSKTDYAQSWCCTFKWCSVSCKLIKIRSRSWSRSRSRSRSRRRSDLNTKCNLLFQLLPSVKSPGQTPPVTCSLSSGLTKTGIYNWVQASNVWCSMALSS